MLHRLINRLDDIRVALVFLIASAGLLMVGFSFASSFMGAILIGGGAAGVFSISFFLVIEKA